MLQKMVLFLLGKPYHRMVVMFSDKTRFWLLVKTMNDSEVKVKLDHKRDFIGYGETPPDPQWPNGARLALTIAINYEEGAESAIPNGDDYSETYLSESMSLTQPPVGYRDLSVESIYEYGSRAGIWRLIRLLTEREMPATVWAVGQAIEKNPLPIIAMAKAGFEIASHHYRWISYYVMSEQEERNHLKRAIAAIKETVGTRPQGIYAGRYSLNTRRLIVEEGGFLYDSDAYGDDLPYWTTVSGKPHLIIPSMLDNNDFRYAHFSGWATGDDFFNYNKATFDQLYQEGAQSPKMMTIALHGRLSGRPGRAHAVARFLDYIKSHSDVWVCTRQQMAEHWYKYHSPNL
ncbi:allantoinase PuuE [SAR92 clade bacterium H231]|nr:allantoinase PuuE [SAR92 clade bacterium H231]